MVAVFFRGATMLAVSEVEPEPCGVCRPGWVFARS